MMNTPDARGRYTVQEATPGGANTASLPATTPRSSPSSRRAPLLSLVAASRRLRCTFAMDTVLIR
uniref:Uncharacterized protein n=1 Tax=Oryza sativa subsp. japonica TaxID=39947 RepID=Q6EPE2_ORYSJ|nr:hypothetical protein [Oryza sativa Japonica Group]